MKKLSITLKITLWFTVFMIVLSAIVFAFIAVVSDSTATNQLRGALTGLVDDNADEVDYDDDVLELDDDFISHKDGISCLVFYANGRKFSGYAPHEELEAGPFENGRIQRITIGSESYLVYDKLVLFDKEEDVWIRGIVLESSGALTSSAVYQAVLFALPLLIILAAVGGYLIAKRSLRPIQKISETAEEIGSSGDLSKRIEMDSNGDELHRLAGTFNNMFDRLEANFEAERHFTSDASHELRTPVTTILAQCEYAFENASGEQELYEAIGAIQKQGYRMSRLIESLLHFTRMEQRTEKPTFELIDLSAAVLGVCHEYKELGEKNITLTAYVQPGIGMKADTALMAQLLGNLIKNAYRYGVENGSIQVNLRAENQNIVLSVADNGVGIASDELPNIWNRFYRVEKSRSAAKGSGFGLGLAVVRQIADLHRGKIYVKSELSRGTIFTIVFPEK